VRFEEGSCSGAVGEGPMQGCAHDDCEDAFEDEAVGWDVSALDVGGLRGGRTSISNLRAHPRLPCVEFRKRGCRRTLLQEMRHCRRLQAVFGARIGSTKL
jgi:hypothetical protein